ncbi:CAP domain-containing protein [Haliangium sp.]|uniref:CAP domain-containing protein n=1 Tax=Haliangium sp. TaxID=2663208 RepID=UPI003D0DA432
MTTLTASPHRALLVAALGLSLAGCVSPYGSQRSTPDFGQGLDRPASARDAYHRPKQPHGRFGGSWQRPVTDEQTDELRAKSRQRRAARLEARNDAVAAMRARFDAMPPETSAKLLALEEALVAEINQLRQDPAGYTEKLATFRHRYNGRVVSIPGYMAVRTREGTRAVNDAITQARRTAPVSHLDRSKGLSHAARAHAFRLGEQGGLSTGDGDGGAAYGRMDLFGRVEGMFAENIGAVYGDANLMILELFVDDGIDTRVHRYNLLGEMFTVVGVGCAPHAKYSVVCVMNFAEGFDEEAPSATALQVD